MKLHHLHLTVPDVTETVNFLKTYFDMKSRWRSWGSDKLNKNFTVLFDEGGFVLTLIKAKKGIEIRYPGFFHIGFPQENNEKVDEIYHRLKEDGFDVEPPAKAHSYTFYVEAPGGFLVEIFA